MTRTTVDYAALSLDQVRSGLEAAADDVRATFGGLDARQLNWRPDATGWSVAQCFDHLLTANRLMIQAADAALVEGAPRSVWQRLPVVPGVLGRMLIRSQSPDATRRFTAPAQAHPSASDIDAGVIQSFAGQQRDAVASVQALDPRRVAQVIMTSPFAKVVVYSVLDGWRLLLAHERRHIEQARRVARTPGFPALRTVD